MSDTRSTGWDHPDDTATEPLPLCGFHTTVTERVSTEHANQIARQAPCCIALKAS